MIATDHSQSKAPRNYNTFLSFSIFELVLVVDNPPVFYAFLEQKAHSRHVISYSKDHVLPRKFGKQEKLLKIETKAKLL